MHTLIVSSKRQPLAAREDLVHVATPLDAIIQLEGARPIRTVVLAGSYASNHELASFLAASYPDIQIESEG